MIRATPPGYGRYCISDARWGILDYSDLAKTTFEDIAVQALRHVYDRVSFCYINTDKVLATQEDDSKNEYRLDYYSRDKELTTSDIESINLHLEGLINHPNAVLEMIEQLCNLIIRDIGSKFDEGASRVRVWFGPADTPAHYNTLGQAVYCFVSGLKIETETRYYIEATFDKQEELDNEE